MSPTATGAPSGANPIACSFDGLSAEHYQEHATNVAPLFNDWPGLLSKLWIGDAGTATYGGIYLFESKADADRSRATPPFQGLSTNPAFADLENREFEVLDELTSITAGALSLLVG